MKELFFLGAAVFVGIATLTVLIKRSGGECLP